MIFDGVSVRRAVCDSRQADADTIFVCLRGQNADGHRFASAAYARGCRCFVCEEALSLPDDARQRIVPDTRAALAELSAECLGNPAQQLTIIGITGTKGKSTVAYMLWHVLNETGHSAALIGTLGIFLKNERRPTLNTTPESNILQQTFAEALEAGCRYVVMEVSSQAAKLKRIHGIPFALAIFTNLTPGDHIGPGEHADYNEYRSCKAELFRHAAQSLLNADDPESAYMASASAGACRWYGLERRSAPVDWQGSAVQRAVIEEQAGMRFSCGALQYRLTIPGRYNVSNALAVIGACAMLGLDAPQVRDALASVHVPGRLEPVITPMTDRQFIIDYAHNGYSLRKVLETLREYRPGRLICLFGSVGGRTQIRRRELGSVAGELCDFVIITSDNPDNENPEQIIAEIAHYVGACPHICISDRADAIRYAVEHSRPGDMVLFAGKGHEDYQLIDGRHVPFCERELIREAVSRVLV